jgi:GMP synthase (glutamine-hydrolysing)
MKFLIINNAEENILEFVNPLKTILSDMKVNYNIIQYSQIFACRDYKGIILSGSPMGNDIVEHHLKYYEWIKTCNKFIFGICAGHQIIGRLFKAELIRGKEREIGKSVIRIIKDDPIFKGYNKKFIAFQQHNDSTTLPMNFELLATSEKCRVQMMKFKSIYSTQFHPEKLNQKLVKNFINLVKP